jgi:hypothetical protein
MQDSLDNPVTIPFVPVVPQMAGAQTKKMTNKRQMKGHRDRAITHLQNG